MGFVSLTSIEGHRFVIDAGVVEVITDTAPVVVSTMPGDGYAVKEDFATVVQLIAEMRDDFIPDDDPFAWPTSMTRGA